MFRQKKRIQLGVMLGTAYNHHTPQKHFCLHTPGFLFNHRSTMETHMEKKYTFDAGAQLMPGSKVTQQKRGATGARKHPFDAVNQITYIALSWPA